MKTQKTNPSGYLPLNSSTLQNWYLTSTLHILQSLVHSLCLNLPYSTISVSVSILLLPFSSSLFLFSFAFSVLSLIVNSCAPWNHEFPGMIEVINEAISTIMQSICLSSSVRLKKGKKIRLNPEAEEFKKGELPGRYTVKLLYGWDNKKFDEEYLKKLEKNWNR